MAILRMAHLSMATAPLSYFQAVVLGLLQGVTELFPISSLGHTVLFPTLFGWHTLVRSQSDPESFWLAFVVMLHVGSAVGLLIYFWRDWVQIIKGFFTSLRKRRVETVDEKLAWLIIAASIPTGILGLLLEHPVRVALAKPTAAAIFLMVNGGPDRGRAAAPTPRPSVAGGSATPGSGRGTRDDDAELQGGGRYRARAVDGVDRRDQPRRNLHDHGLLRGLNNEDAARFAFLLATPIILAAGIFKLPDLTGPLGSGIRGQAVVAAVCAALAAIAAVHWLLRYFRNNNLTPFGIYCLVFGFAMVIYTTT